MPGNGSKKILIADNDEEVVIAFEHALETAGYEPPSLSMLTKCSGYCRSPASI